MFLGVCVTILLGAYALTLAIEMLRDVAPVLAVTTTVAMAVFVAVWRVRRRREGW